MRNIFVPGGKVSRLHRRKAIAKGQWYFSVFCPECNQPICFLADPRPQGGPNPFVGEGKLSIACEVCGADKLYATGDIVSIAAARDIPTTRPPRIEPSTMPRQKLSRKYPGAKPTFGPGLLEERPKAAALVARCLALWSDVEVQLARLMAALLRANTEPAVATFLALKNSRTQTDLLEAAASRLSEDDKRIFDVLMKLKTSLEKERVSLAHGQFGACPQVKDGLLWVAQIDHVHHTARTEVQPVTGEMLKAFCDTVSVYELADLEKIAQDFEEFHKELGAFITYLKKFDDDQWQRERYPELCALPLVRRELSLSPQDTKRSP